MPEAKRNFAEELLYANLRQLESSLVEENDCPGLLANRICQVLFNIRRAIEGIEGDGSRALILDHIANQNIGWLTPDPSEVDWHTGYDLATDVQISRSPGGRLQAMDYAFHHGAVNAICQYHSRFARNDQLLRGMAKTIKSLYAYVRSHVSRAVSDGLMGLYEILKRPTRVLIVGDREVDNARSLLLHEKQHWDLTFAGMVVPAADVDDIFVEEVFMNMPQAANGIGNLPVTDTNALAAFVDDPHGIRMDSLRYQDMEAHTPLGYASFGHVHYDKAKNKAYPDYREQYCRRLFERVIDTQAEVVYLSNFKLILDPVFIQSCEAAGIPVINCHPSVLPLNKGWRTESMAVNDRINPEASGYTMHMVVEDLDCGPTLFMQHVEPKPYDEEEAQRVGVKKYRRQREEEARLEGIRAQSIYSPRVIAMVASDRPRKILEDEEAFTAEGRSGFLETAAYIEESHNEYRHWQHQDPDARSDVDYGDWYANYRTPYRRVVFQTEDGSYQTLETIFGAEKTAKPESITKKHIYRFGIPMDQGFQHAYRIFQDISSASRGAHDGGIDKQHSANCEPLESGGRRVLFCQIETVIDIGPWISKYQLPYIKEPRTVLATAKRRGPFRPARTTENPNPERHPITKPAKLHLPDGTIVEVPPDFTLSPNGEPSHDIELPPSLRDRNPVRRLLPEGS